MKSSIKIIKRKRDEYSDEDSVDLITREGEKSIAQGTLEIMRTVKNWIGELRERKRAQDNSFLAPPGPKVTVIILATLFALTAGSSERNLGVAQKPNDGTSNRQPTIKVDCEMESMSWK